MSSLFIMSSFGVCACARAVRASERKGGVAVGSVCFGKENKQNRIAST